MKTKGVIMQWMGETFTALTGLARNRFQRDMGSPGLGIDGLALSPENSLGLSSVWACVRLISETIATLPFNFYESKGAARNLATKHPLYNVLRSMPNADTTSVTFWEVIVASLLLWGNAYAVISRNSQGQVIALDFLHPGSMSILLTDDRMQIIGYRYAANGRYRTIDPGDMLHIRGFSLDGVIGLSPVMTGALVMSGAMVAEKAARDLFQCGMRASGFVTVAEFLNEKTRPQMRENLDKFRGNQNPGAVMLLEGGSSYTPLTMNPVDAELLATRKHSGEEICRWFRVPPFMVGYGDKTSTWGTGIEQMMIGFVTFVLRPWCVRIEKAINASCLNLTERGRYFCEFAMEGLLRGDSASRAAFYSICVNNGIMTRDEVRQLENWPVMGNNAGQLTVQSAMTLLDKIGADAPAVQAQSLDAALKKFMEGLQAPV